MNLEGMIIWHEHCPEGKERWCRFKCDKATGESTFKPGAGFPLSLSSNTSRYEHIKPIFQDLSRDDLLNKMSTRQNYVKNSELE